MTDAEKLALSKRACELLGIEWHELVNHVPDGIIGDAGKCICGKIHFLSTLKKVNPDFTTDAGKVELLRLMRKQEYWEDFKFELAVRKHNKESLNSAINNVVDCILGDSLLLKAAVEFMEGRK